MKEIELAQLLAFGFKPNNILLEYEEDINIINSLLLYDLERTFKFVNNKPDLCNIDVIHDIYVKFRGFDIFFTIEILHAPFYGKYTSWCPELCGCFAEGDTKFDSLKNLIYGIAEIFVLNYDRLKTNPFSRYGKSPLDANTDIFGTKYRNYFMDGVHKLYEQGFQSVFMGFQNLLIKKEINDNTTFLIPYNGYNDFSEMIIDNMLEAVNY